MIRKSEFIKFLGRGCYGSVYLVKFINIDGSSLYAAVKICESEDYAFLYKETQILSKLRGCSGIVQCYDHNLQEDFDADGFKVYKMVMEYAEAGNLSSFLNMKKNRKLTDSMIKYFTSMILEGLVSIHDHDYVHCDLKPENILVFFDGPTYKLKISDFGSALKEGEIGEYWEVDTPFLGSALYMSPESVREGKAKKTLDLWSLGCIVLEMCTGVRPWLGLDCDGVEARLLNGEAPEIPASVACDARQFLEKCFRLKDEERGSALELLEHTFLTGEVPETEEMTAACGERKSVKLKNEDQSSISREAKKYSVPEKEKKEGNISRKPRKF